MPIRVIVNGAAGRMGREAVIALQSDSAFGPVEGGYRTDDLAQLIKIHRSEVVVDFTHAAVALSNALVIIEAGARPVIGTSGLLPADVKRLQQLCASRQQGAAIVPNFCLAAVLMMKLAQQAASHFSEAEIIEMHHDCKLDSPSATALKTAEMIAANRSIEPSNKPLYETLAGARGAVSQGTPIHAIRLPGILARQEVLFGYSGGSLSIGYHTISRTAYMPGVRLACKKVLQLSELVYGLEHFL